MAHSSDRTLLASLGFQDPDRKSSTHTLACQYLCEPEVTAKLAKMLWPSVMISAPEPRSTTRPVKPDDEGRVIHPRAPDDTWGILAPVALTEVAVRRDRRFLIGFWDVGIRFEGSGLGWVHTGHEFGLPKPGRDSGYMATKEERAEWDAFTASRVDLFQTTPRRWASDVLIEVKAGVVDVADIARQIETYATGCPDLPSCSLPRRSGHAVVATCWPMSSGDRATLAAKNIRHIHLADAFKAYCKRREQDEIGGDAL